MSHIPKLLNKRPLSAAQLNRIHQRIRDLLEAEPLHDVDIHEYKDSSGNEIQQHYSEIKAKVYDNICFALGFGHDASQASIDATGARPPYLPEAQNIKLLPETVGDLKLILQKEVGDLWILSDPGYDAKKPMEVGSSIYNSLMAARLERKIADTILGELPQLLGRSVERSPAGAKDGIGG